MVGKHMPVHGAGHRAQGFLCSRQAFQQLSAPPPTKRPLPLGWFGVPMGMLAG